MFCFQIVNNALLKSHTVINFIIKTDILLVKPTPLLKYFKFYLYDTHQPLT